MRRPEPAGGIQSSKRSTRPPPRARAARRWRARLRASSRSPGRHGSGPWSAVEPWAGEPWAEAGAGEACAREPRAALTSTQTRSPSISHTRSTSAAHVRTRRPAMRHPRRRRWRAARASPSWPSSRSLGSHRRANSRGVRARQTPRAQRRQDTHPGHRLRSMKPAAPPPVDLGGGRSGAAGATTRPSRPRPRSSGCRLPREFLGSRRVRT